MKIQFEQMGGDTPLTREKVQKYIYEKYNILPEYPWFRYPKYAVFRQQNNKKWFAVVMDLEKSKLGIEGEGIVDALNIKCDTFLISSLLSEKGFFPGYHMNKLHWITIALDGSVAEEKIKGLLDLSFELTDNK